MHCTFCTDAAKAGTIVFEDDRAWVFLHSDWAVAGHAMIVTKRHVENVGGLDADEWLHLAGVWHRAERALLDLTGADRVIAMKLGIQTPHLHIHLYPFSAEATRQDVFASIDGAVRVAENPSLVEALRRVLDTASPAE